MGEGASKQTTIVGAAGSVGSALQSASQNQNLRDSNTGGGKKKEDATTDPNAGGETGTNPPEPKVEGQQEAPAGKTGGDTEKKDK